MSQKIEKILFVEEDSISPSVERVCSEIEARNPEIKVIVYKKNSRRPILANLSAVCLPIQSAQEDK